MANNNQPQQAPAAGGCLVTFNQNFPPPTATAKPGTLQFKLEQVTNTILFKQGNCKVTDENNVDVPFKLGTALTSISFKAEAGKTYTLAIAYLPVPPGHPASANFREDCSNSQSFITVDQTTALADYVIAVTN